eukprot:jgi/Psemu1/7183/gm1.7183_g
MFHLDAYLGTHLAKLGGAQTEGSNALRLTTLSSSPTKARSNEDNKIETPHQNIMFTFIAFLRNTPTQPFTLACGRFGHTTTQNTTWTFASISPTLSALPCPFLNHAAPPTTPGNARGSHSLADTYRHTAYNPTRTPITTSPLPLMPTTSHYPAGTTSDTQTPPSHPLHNTATPLQQQHPPPPIPPNNFDPTSCHHPHTPTHFLLSYPTLTIYHRTTSQSTKPPPSQQCLSPTSSACKPNTCLSPQQYCLQHLPNLPQDPIFHSMIQATPSLVPWADPVGSACMVGAHTDSIQAKALPSFPSKVFNTFLISIAPINTVSIFCTWTDAPFLPDIFNSARQ